MAATSMQGVVTWKSAVANNLMIFVLGSPLLVIGDRCRVLARYFDLEGLWLCWVPKPGLVSRHRQKFQVGVGGTGGELADSGEVSDSLASDAPESFSWSSVILPFIFPALGGLLFGYDIGATSGATLSLQSATLSGTTWFNLSPVQLGLVVSGSLYGALLGSTLVYGIADFLGRRRELIIAAGLYLLGSLITGCAPDLNVLLLGRLLYGLGIGLVSS